MEENGTRQRQSKYNERPESRFPNNKYTTDVGLNKLLTIAATFTAVDGKITDAASDFVAAGFAVNDQIIIWNSASNNGVRTITAVASHAITVDWPVTDEGPTTGVVVRNT